MKKEWVPIQGYEGIYEISMDGSIRSLDRYVVRSDGVKQFKKGKLMTYHINSDGYPTVHLSKNGKSERICVHILVARAFVDNPNGLTEVNHLDFDRTNYRYDNLEWTTHRDNILYSINAGRHVCNDVFGDKNPNYHNTKLKEYYASHPEEKMKLARKGKQNGRCVPVTLIEPNGKISSFDYLIECATYMMENGYTSAKCISSVADGISVAKKKNKRYMNCQFK